MRHWRIAEWVGSVVTGHLHRMTVQLYARPGRIASDTCQPPALTHAAIAVLC
jgi:hypothetical protein